MTEKEPEITATPNPWWEKIVSQLPVDQEYKRFLLSINVTPVKEGKERKLFANTPDGQREVQFSTVSGTPALAYVEEETTNGPKIKFVLLPRLPLEEITRRGLLDKRLWGGVEEQLK